MKPLLLHYFMGLVLIVSLSDCQHVETSPPKAEGFDPPISTTVSHVAGSIEFPIRELEEKINRELDPLLVGKGAPGGKRGGVFPFRVARSGRVRIQYENQQLRFSTPLQLWITKPFSKDKTPPDKPFCSLHINFQSPLTVTPDWRLASRVKFTSFDWIIKPEIKILGQEIQLTDFVRNLLDRYQPAIESAIDTAIYKELRIDQIVGPIWQDIQKPLLVSKEFGLWLLPKPVRVETSPISGGNGSIITHLRIALNTETKLKPTTPAYTPTQLPTLERKEQLPLLSDLRLVSDLPYADINRVLNLTLSQQKKRLLFGAVTIRNVAVYGGQRTLLVKTEVGGLMDGVIYLRGRPVFDTLTNTLRVSNLDFDAASQSGMPRFVSSLVRKSLLKLVDELLEISLGDEINKLPQKITQAYEKGGAGKKTDLVIQSFRFTPEQIAIRPTGIQTLIHVQSKVGLRVRQL
ncbi:DUF4403 family protein [Spirosoma sordidisoli]|uniref:DUF4403 family protein n=1 Tax=Spirosoma sordidisoli TaxID=2502893 RepID=A0A4Q2UPM2_9BACT|nr:DUF4403 family protein [Spirosoma sordidisoli]RYC69570.1 DUF4403 family protein [Spirosoma sordidisoli]